MVTHLILKLELDRFVYLDEGIIKYQYLKNDLIGCFSDRLNFMGCLFMCCTQSVLFENFHHMLVAPLLSRSCSFAHLKEVFFNLKKQPIKSMKFLNIKSPTFSQCTFKFPSSYLSLGFYNTFKTKTHQEEVWCSRNVLPQKLRWDGKRRECGILKGLLMNAHINQPRISPISKILYVYISINVYRRTTVATVLLYNWEKRTLESRVNLKIYFVFGTKHSRGGETLQYEGMETRVERYWS